MRELNMSKVKNGGVIPDPRPISEKALDYVAGVNSPIEYEYRVENWDDYLPIGVPQSNKYFDTYACTHFSAVHSVDCQIKWLWKNGKLPQKTIDWLLQYFPTPEAVQFSPRFNAICGNNTPGGNYFQAAWDSARHDGLIPDALLPFGDAKNWAEYHNKKLITVEMRKIGKEFLEHFTVEYEIVYVFDQYPQLNKVEKENLVRLTKQAPPQIGIPLKIEHAIILTKINEQVDTFEQYKPYHRVNDKRPIGFAIRGVLNVRKLTATPHLTRLLKIGMSGEDVRQLQANLRTLGYFTYPFGNTNYFGVVTQMALKNFQRENGIPETGQYWTLSHAQLYKLLNK